MLKAIDRDRRTATRRPPRWPRTCSGSRGPADHGAADRAPERLWRWCRRNPAMAALLSHRGGPAPRPHAGIHLRGPGGSPTSETRRPASQRRAESAEEQLAGRLWQSYVSQARAERNSHLVGQRFQSLDAMAAAARIRVSACELRDEAIACLGLVDLRLVACPAGPTAGRPGVRRRCLRWSDSPSPTGPAHVSVRRVSDGTELAPPAARCGIPVPACDSAPTPAISRPSTSARDGHSRGILWDLGQPERPKRVAEVTDDIVPLLAGRQANGRPDRPRDGRRLDQTGGAEPSDRLNVGNLTHVLAFSPDGRRIAILDSPARTIRIYDLETRGLVSVSRVSHGPPGAGLARRRPAACGELPGPSDLRVGHGQEPDPVGPRRAIRTMSSPSSSLTPAICSSRRSWDITTRVWDPVRGRPLLTWPGRSPGNPRRQPTGRDPRARPAGRALGAGQPAASAAISIMGWWAIGPPRPEAWGPRGLSFSPDGRLLASSDVGRGLPLGCVHGHRGGSSAHRQRRRHRVQPGRITPADLRPGATPDLARRLPPTATGDLPSRSAPLERWTAPAGSTSWARATGNGADGS